MTALGETALLARPDAGPLLLTIDPFEETVLLVREQVYNAGMPSFAASVRLLDLPVKTFRRRDRSTVEALMKIGWPVSRRVAPSHRSSAVSACRCWSQGLFHKSLVEY